MSVFILGSPDDDHVRHMASFLRKRGGDAEVLDSRWFPSEMTLAFDPITTRGRLRLPNGRVIDLATVTAVYWRTYNGVVPLPLPNAEQAHIAGNDARSLFESLLIRLPARWVNGWRGFQLHQTKPAQLARVAGVGVPVPATVVGNEPEMIVDFARKHPRCIFKPVQGGAHARRLTPEYLTPENLKNLALAPITLQEEVPGTNLRVFVAGERVMACEIQTNALDYRDDQSARLRAHDLPAEVTHWCRAAATEVDLIWAGIDLRRTPEGRYVFLEANPSPMFLRFEAETGLPISDSLASLLLRTN